LYDKFPAFVQSLADPNEHYRSFHLHVLPLSQTTPTNNTINFPIVLDARDLETDHFHTRYEANELPCLIQNIPAGYDGGREAPKWPAVDTWTFENLKRNDGLQKRTFKCGEDDDGDNITVKLIHFLSYLERGKDDSPLYVFDSHFDEDRVAKSIVSDYRVPTYFGQDLFGLVSESRRPPYRWWLIGPKRSGTCIHVDPLATNAWNTLIVGKKRWVLFPPHVSKRIVKGKGLVRNDEDDEAVHYFMFILPRIKRKAVSLADHAEYRDFACYEFTQTAGETVFVPNGWWHAVLNLTDTVGITQNFCSPRNFDKVWRSTRTERKKMASKWLCLLDQQYPEFGQRARELNRMDGFQMKYDPDEMKRKEEERQDKLTRL
jgi:histone arginine demethylase JMJD6